MSALWCTEEILLLLVKVGGKEKKAIVLPPEAFPAFMDAAFSQDNALGTRAQGVTNERPFFKPAGGKC